MNFKNLLYNQEINKINFMKILIISALSQELKIIKDNIKILKIKDINVQFLCTWMWNYSTIYILTKYLEKNEVDFVVNIWICWYKSKKNDFIQIWRIFNFTTKKEILVPIFFEFWKIVSILCSETPVFDNKILKEENYVDMESFWVEFVLDKFKIPRIILKVPVDKIWKETKNFDHNKALKLLEKNISYKKLILEIQKYFDI